MCLCVGKLYVKECCVCVCLCRDARATRMPPSATHAIQSQRRWHQFPHLPRKRAATSHRPRHPTRARPVPQVPCLPLKVPWRRGRPCRCKGAPGPAQYRKCHACHAKGKSMSPSATPATYLYHVIYLNFAATSTSFFKRFLRDLFSNRLIFVVNRDQL